MPDKCPYGRFDPKIWIRYLDEEDQGLHHIHEYIMHRVGEGDERAKALGYWIDFAANARINGRFYASIVLQGDADCVKYKGYRGTHALFAAAMALAKHGVRK